LIATEGGVADAEDYDGIRAVANQRVRRRQGRVRQGFEPFGLHRRQHHALHPEILTSGGAGLSGSAIDEHPVTARREPLADLFHAGLEAAIGRRHTASAQHGQAHLARIVGTRGRHD